MRAVAIVICLMLVVGCGGPDSAEPTTGSAAEPTAGTTAEPATATTESTAAVVEPTATATADPCETAFHATPSRQLASIAPVEDGTRTLATSWVLFKDIHELAWASHLIVRGQVVADCNPNGDDESVQVNPDWDMRMLVKIDAVYRGWPRDSILVPATSDGFSNDLAMTFEIGNEVILFLGQPEDGGAFPMGGPQGHWRVVNGRTVPNAGHYPDLPVDTFEQALAAALNQEPPASSEGHVLSLAVAPLGPDLPDDREPPLACDGTVPPPGERIEAATDLVWVSERIVIGTISEVRDSFLPDDSASDVDPSLRVPVTDYVVQVEQHLRGTPVETVVLRLFGGTVDGCTVVVHGAPELMVGDRLLLFLTPLDANGTSYLTSSGQRGLWQVAVDGTLAANTAWQWYPEVVPTADLTGLVATALAGAMPQDPWQEYNPVPLDASPLGETSRPEPGTPDGWASYADSNRRLSLNHPAEWTVIPTTEETMTTLTSWSASAMDEPVPGGEVRVEIREMPGSRWFDDPTSVPVAIGHEFGWLYFHSSHWPLDPAAPDQVHYITAGFLHNGVALEVKATFGAQPTPDDPATLAFYTLLRSIQRSES